MRIRMVSLEDGIIACGFRKMAAYVASLNPDTGACYVTTAHQYKSVRNAINGSRGTGGELTGSTRWRTGCSARISSASRR